MFNKLFDKMVQSITSRKVIALSLVGMASVTALSFALATDKMTWKDLATSKKGYAIEYEYSKPLHKLAMDNVNSVTLPAGTAVVLRLTDNISSDDAVTGSTVSFSVVQDVKVDDHVVIRAGTPGQAQVSSVEDNGMIGQAGKIIISDFSVRGVGGEFIPLRTTISEKGKDKMVLSLGVTLITGCLPLLLIKGGAAKVPAGIEKTAYTASDVKVKF